MSDATIMIISIRKTDIPEYLKRGELYRNLMENNDDPNEEVTFPAEVLKPDTTINIVKDVDYLLNSARYWGVERFVSKELIVFVLSSDDSTIVDVLQKYEAEFYFVACLRQLLLSVPSEKINIAIKSGIIEIVQVLAESGIKIPDDACDLAAEAGNLDVFVYLYEHGSYWTIVTGVEAARHGHMDILKFMKRNGFRVSRLDLSAAIAGGQLECVKSEIFTHPTYFHTYPRSDACNEAVVYGQLEILTYLHSVGYHWDTYTTTDAADHGQLHCLQYLHEQGCPWDVEAVGCCAAYRGHVSCIIYAHEQGAVLPFAEVARAAVDGGHRNCLQYAHSHGCTWTIATSTSLPNSCSVRFEYNGHYTTSRDVPSTHSCWKCLHRRAARILS